MFPCEETEKHDVVLDLNNSKSNGLFPTDQTPTPTGLFRNCEEFGIFEDLKHVNPFEEIFRNAVEEKTGKTQLIEKPQISPHINDDEGSLHTPQVFPQIESPAIKNVTITRAQSSSSDLTTPTPTIHDLVTKSATTTEKLQQTINKKYRPIAQKPTTTSAEHTLTVNFNDASIKADNLATTIGTAIPIQTVKPLILPKVDTCLKPTKTITNQQPVCTVTSPSSASLTPTSQLPIKERLKVILNNNNKSQRINTITSNNSSSNSNSDSACKPNNNNGLPTTRQSTTKYNERCLERRRAAATRYRNKMRNEYKELKKQNTELQTENEKLRNRISELEGKLAQKELKQTSNAPNTQLQIPPSSIHLIMNIPKLVVPTYGPPILHNPITYSVEKK